MKRYYYSNEQSKIVSIDEVKQEFTQFQLEGEYTDISFEYYLQGCMYYNNGDLTPVIDKIFALKKKLAKLYEASWRYGKSSFNGIIIDIRSDIYDDEINELKEQIAYFEQYY